MAEPITTTLVVSILVSSFLGACSRQVVVLVKTVVENVVYQQDNEYKKLVVRKNELVKRDKECKQ